MSQDLTKLHTKQLLAMLHNIRAGYSNEVNYGSLAPNDLTEVTVAVEKRISALKAELAKRPHVPTKAEAKKIRQEAAKRR